MNNTEIKEYRRLKQAGWQVDKTPSIRMNGGSTESLPHLAAKTCTAYVAREYGYLVSTETVHETHGEIDVLAYAPDRLNYALEVETEPTADVVADKKARYVDSNEVIDEIQVIAVDELPRHLYDMRDRIQTKLGFF